MIPYVYSNILRRRSGYMANVNNSPNWVPDDEKMMNIKVITSHQVNTRSIESLNQFGFLEGKKSIIFIR